MNIVILLNWLISIPESPYALVLMAVITTVVLAHSDRSRTAKAIDFAPLLFVTILLVHTSKSLAPTNSVHFVLPYGFALCAYFALRCRPLQPLQLEMILIAGQILAVAIAACDLYLLFRARHALAHFQGTPISLFRFNLKYVGGPTRNDGSTVLLQLLPFTLIGLIGSCIKRAFRVGCFHLLATIIVVSALILTFSQGIYVALAVFALLLLLGIAVTSTQQFRIQILTAFLITCFGVGIAIHVMKSETAVKETVQFTRLESRQRSASGRLTIWNDVLDVMHGHWALGIGGGVDGLVQLSMIQRHPERPPTARAYNAELEILIAAGAVGLTAFFIFFGQALVPAKTAFRHFTTSPYKCIVVLCLCSGIVAALVRDLTYSSVVLHGASIVLLWTSNALVLNIGDDFSEL